jgi:hypothetical protein
VRGQFRFGLLELGEQPRRVRDEQTCGVGEPHSAPPAFHQRLADLALEAGELLRRRGRGDGSVGAMGTLLLGGDLPVDRLGFGALRLRPSPAPDRQASIAVARRAVELGITLIDTADS